MKVLKETKTKENILDETFKVEMTVGEALTLKMMIGHTTERNILEGIECSCFAKPYENMCNNLNTSVKDVLQCNMTNIFRCVEDVLVNEYNITLEKYKFDFGMEEY